jgi:hypothetical protein
VQHGKAALTRVLRTIPLDDLDGRSEAGVFLRRTREDLADQLVDVTPAQQLLINEAARTALIAQALGDYIARQETLVRADASLLPVVIQREQVVGNLVRILLALGLKRGAKPVQPFQQFLAERGAKVVAQRDAVKG